MRDDVGATIHRGKQSVLLRHPLGYYLILEPKTGVAIAGGYLSEDVARVALEIAELPDNHDWPEAEIIVCEIGLPEAMGVEVSRDGQVVGVGLYDRSARTILGVDLPGESLRQVADIIHAEAPHSLSGMWNEYEWRLFLGEAIEAVRGFGQFIYGSESELVGTVHEWLECGTLPDPDWVGAGVFTPPAQLALIRAGLVPEEVGRSMVEITGDEDHRFGLERLGYLVSNGDLTTDQVLELIRSSQPHPIPGGGR